MSQLRELRAWTHELFDQYGWLILANYSRNTRQVREYIKSVEALQRVLREYYKYVRNRRTSGVVTPLTKLIKQVDLLHRRLQRNYGNNNRNRNRNYRNSFN